MRRRIVLCLAITTAALTMATAAQASHEGKLHGNTVGHGGRADADGAITIVVSVDQPGSTTITVPDNLPDGDRPAQTVRYSAAYDHLDASGDPACLTMRWITVSGPGASQDTADSIAARNTDATRLEVELRIDAGEPAPLPCDAPPPVLPDPTYTDVAARRWAEELRDQLPPADPTIGTPYAVTGLRTWLDLGRPSTHTATASVDVGPESVDVELVATATAEIAWGDGTTTVTSAAGGGYHDGQPGPDDITHHYTDRRVGTVLTVTDTWTITVSFPSHTGLADITLTHAMPVRTTGFDVREVRSSRDS